MSKISQVRRCYNCGAVLQCDDPSKEGYVKKETLENASQNFLFCDSCFEVERYRNNSNEPLITEDYLRYIEDAKARNALLVYVVNSFSFEASFSSKINSIINGMDIVVVGNKADLLPEHLDEDETREYIAHRFRASGVHVTTEDVILAEATNDEIAKAILSRIYESRNGRDVYCIGQKESGKTTLVTSFLRVYSNMSKGNISTHLYPNTNLTVMEIPLSSKSSLFDGPGIPNENSVLFNIDRQTDRLVSPHKAVEGRKVTLGKGQVLFVGGMAFFEVIDGKKTAFTCYFNDTVVLKKSSSIHAEEKFVQLTNRKRLVPASPRIHSLKDIDTFDIVVTESNQRDLGIQGLGWFSFYANNQTIRIRVPKGVAIYSSRPKVLK